MSLTDMDRITEPAPFWYEPLLVAKPLLPLPLLHQQFTGRILWAIDVGHESSQ